MSAGSEFHATGPEKLKARSLNAVRRRVIISTQPMRTGQITRLCGGDDSHGPVITTAQSSNDDKSLGGRQAYLFDKKRAVEVARASGY